MGSVSTSLKVDTSFRGIILLTIPISLARLIPELNFLFNAIFLGHLGTKELAYAALTGVYYLIFAAVGYGLSNAILSMISRQAGEDNRGSIINTLRHGFIVAGILSAIAVFSTFFLLDPILYLAEIKQEDVHAVSMFMKIRIFGLIFLYAYQLSNSYLICIQETKWLLIGSLVEAIANIVFDYWFIFGGMGIRPMGFNGAAWASILSEVIGFLVVTLVISVKKFSVKYDLPTFWKYNKKLLIQVLNQSGPLMGQYAISIIAWWVFYIMLNRNYNYQEQAASQAMRNLFGISGVFSWAFGATTNTVISNLIGQGKFHEVKSTMHKILYISGGGMLAFIFFVNIFPDLVFSLFGQEATFKIAATSLLRVVTSAMLLLTISVVWLNSVVATGNTKYVFLAEFASITAYLMYTFYVIEIAHYSITTAWMSEWIYWGVMFIMCFGYMKQWFKRSISDINYKN